MSVRSGRRRALNGRAARADRPVPPRRRGERADASHATRDVLGLMLSTNAELKAQVLRCDRDTLDVKLGGFLELGPPAVSRRARHTVTDVPLTFARGVRTERVVLDPDRLVAGFFVLESGDV